MRHRSPLTWSLLCAVGAIVLAAGLAQAQIWRGGYGFNAPPRRPTVNTFVGAFNFCRLMFSSNRREKRGWSTDYPGADINFSIRLAELTRTRVTKQKDGDPEYITVAATDDALFQCPFVLVEDGGSARFSGDEVIRLREYLEKAASSSPRTTGAPSPVSSGTTRSDACCRATSTPSSISRRRIRSGIRCTR